MVPDRYKRLTFFNRQLDNLAADLRTDLDLQYRLNPAVGRHQFGDVPSRDFFRLHADHDFTFTKEGNGGQADQNQPDGGKNDDALAFSSIWVCHEYSN